jgi:hypothetical protein
MDRKRIILFGLGSAGRRFAEILKDKKFEVYVYEHRKGIETLGFLPLTDLNNLSDFYAAIVASPTATHLEYLEKLIDSQVPAFIEKPLADNLEAAKRIVAKGERNKARIQVGFNLRYLPIVTKIGNYFRNGRIGKILHADIYVGQYLPDWRPNKNYRKTYSASLAAGGGVALDLIHEIDLAQMWFRDIELKVVHSTKLSDLDIDTEDFVEFTTESQPYIKVTLDYLNMLKTRRYTIVGSEGTIECDIFNKKFTYRSKGGKEETLTDENLFDIKKTYESEIDDFLAKVESGQKFDLSDRTMGLDSLKLAVEARGNVQK